MRQEQEQFRQQFSLYDEGADINSPRGWNRIDTSGVLHATEASRERRLLEVRFGLRQESSKEQIEKGSSQESDGFDRVRRGFEPFVDLNDPLKPPQQEEVLFVNCYNGNYAQKMELNREGVERALTIAHLEGKVFLTTLALSRSRSEAQGNELVAKRFLLFENKAQKIDEENPYKRVVPVPKGWRIEINDRRILEELAEKRLSGEKLQRTFINKFNSQLKEALKECIWREKCSSEKDRYFKIKLLVSVSPVPVSVILLINASIFTTLSYYGVIFISYGIVNILDRVSMRRFRSFENMEIYPSSKPSNLSRNIDRKWEYFMPLVEIDKVARTFTYLAIKGRRLVREIKE